MMKKKIEKRNEEIIKTIYRIQIWMKHQFDPTLVEMYLRPAKKQYFDASLISINKNDIRSISMENIVSASSFAGCKKLSSITFIGDALEIMPNLNGCENLSTLSIPDSVNEMYPPLSCHPSLYDETTLPGFKLVDGWILEQTDKTMDHLPDEISVARGICKYAFRENTALTAATIPENVKLDCYGTFRDCPNLISVTLPSRAYGDTTFMFYSDSSLISARIPDGVRGIGQSTCYGCTSLTAVTIPDSIKYITQYAFEDCRNLLEIRLPEGLNYIGENAFYNCTSLTSINIPSSVLAIGNRAFAGCNSISYDVESILGMRLLDGWVVQLDPNNPQEELDFSGPAIHNICDGVGSNNRSVKTLRIDRKGSNYFFQSSSIETIVYGPNATRSGSSDEFLFCDSLTAYIADENNTEFASENGLLLSKDKTQILGNGGVNGNVVIPNTVSSINKNGFYYKRNLTSVSIPNSVTYIGDSAFEGCRSLPTITIPSSVTSIGRYTFSYCNALTSVRLPKRFEGEGRFGAPDTCEFIYVD